MCRAKPCLTFAIISQMPVLHAVMVSSNSAVRLIYMADYKYNPSVSLKIARLLLYRHSKVIPRPTSWLTVGLIHFIIVTFYYCKRGL